MEKLVNLLKLYLLELSKRHKGTGVFDIHCRRDRFSWVGYLVFMPKDKEKIKQFARNKWEKMMEENSDYTRKLLEKGHFQKIPFEYSIEKSEIGFSQYMDEKRRRDYKESYRYNELNGRIEEKKDNQWLPLDIQPTPKDIFCLQQRIYAQIENPVFAWLAMCNPVDFYLGFQPGQDYSFRKIRKIYKDVSLLEAISRSLGKDPHNLSDPDCLF